MLKIAPTLGWPAFRKALGHFIPAVMQVISRGLPYTSSQAGGFGGPNDEANAIDADYGTTWDSVFTPNDGSDEWYVLDLRGVSGADKTSIWLVWKNWHGHPYEASATLGPDGASVFTALPRNYKVQGHTSSGSQPALNDAGWVDLVTVTDNRYNQRIHTGLNLSTYNWFRMRFSAASGVPGATDSIQLQFDLRNVANGSDDSILFYGDSITWEAISARKPGNGVWVNFGPLGNELEATTGRAAPVLIDAGIPGHDAPNADTDKATYIGAFPCKYVTLNFGSNDANLANIDLNDPGVIPNGINSNFAQNYKAKMQSMIDYCVGAGKKVIIPYIPYGDLNTWTNANIIIFNALIDELVAENPGDVMLGPDLYSFFQAHTNCLRDHLHPTYDEAVGGGLYNGLTGYEHYLTLWHDRLIELLY